MKIPILFLTCCTLFLHVQCTQHQEGRTNLADKDTIQVTGKNYSGIIVPLESPMLDLRHTRFETGVAAQVSAADVPRAEEYLAAYIPTFCSTAHSNFDSSDCQAMKEIKSYKRVYSGYKYLISGKRFVIIEACDKKYYDGLKEGEKLSDGGPMVLFFEVCLDNGTVKFMGDGGWG